MASFDFDFHTKRSLSAYLNKHDLKEYLATSRRTLSTTTSTVTTHLSDLHTHLLTLPTIMHLLLLASALLAGATAGLAYPRASQQPLAAVNHPEAHWDPSFDDLCTKEGFFRHPRLCQRFHRCAKTVPGSNELVKFQFECPADQIYCPSQIACVHPWACAEKCSESENGQSTGPSGQGTQLGGKKGGKCKPFVCERPGTFTDPLNCQRFQECESIFVDGDIKLLQSHGDCPNGEIFCAIVGACGKEEACPQKCDRSCTIV